MLDLIEPVSPSLGGWTRPQPDSRIDPLRNDPQPRISMYRNLLKFCISVFSLMSLGVYADTLEGGPFSGVELSALPEECRAVIKNASEDFELAVRGNEPKHATRIGMVRDGGTKIWKADGYALTVFRQLAGLGSGDKKITGYKYGPQMSFGVDNGPCGTLEVSNVRFYTNGQLNWLRESAIGK